MIAFLVVAACILFLYWGSFTNWHDARRMERDRDEWRAIALRGVAVPEQTYPYTGDTQSLEGLD